MYLLLVDQFAMKATVLWKMDGSKITKKRKQLGQLPIHGGKAIKIPRYSFGVEVFTVVTKNAETRTKWP